jgi:uncharacterized protein (TIGR02600 family)
MNSRMKTASNPEKSGAGHTASAKNERAVALIVVLFLVAILSILVIAILSISTNELESARKYADGIEVRQLNETAVSLAIGQIRLGTGQFDAVAGREVWASQPGALRVYGEDGDFLIGVKLYSDSEMSVSDEKRLTADTPPGNWDSDLHRHRYVDLNEPVLRKEQISFPIVDPSAVSYGVEGFDFDESAVSGARKSGKRLDLRIPMPVEWIYVLQNGLLGTLDESGLFVGEEPASEENPLVGRMAFWTDDESSKINVNTASEPTFWDTPRCINQKDMDYGKFQPGRNEYQRYPGHPATTALSPVLFPDAKGPLSTASKEKIYGLIPRIGSGGTRGGTVRPGGVISPDEDRLFATIDEFIFRPDRERAELISPDTLRMAGFFLTANSRAPELNPLGKPKIAMWPLGFEPHYTRTAYDHLMAFCSTSGGNVYAFQRRNAQSSKMDWESIPRNRQIYSWLVRDLGEKIPGPGGSFLDRFGDDLPQVAVGIFDYIRSTNLQDVAPIIKPDGTKGPRRFFAGNGQVTPIRTSDGLVGFGRCFTFSEFGLHVICCGEAGQGLEPDGGEKMKLRDDEKLIEVGFLMEPFSPSMGWPPLHNDFSIRVTGLDELEIEQVEVKADGGRTDEMKSMQFPAEKSFRPGGLGSSWHGRAWGGSSGIRTFVARNNYPFISQRLRVKGDSIKFSGGSVTVEIFEGANPDEDRKIQTIRLRLPGTDFPMPDLVKEGTTAFRGTGGTEASFWWNVRTRYANAASTPHAPGEEYADPKRRWPKDTGGNSPGFKKGGVFRAEDVVRSFVPWHGDYRLVAARFEVPDTVFRPLPNYDDRTANFDHLFADTQGTQLLYGFSNEPGLTSREEPKTQLTPATYHYSRLPDVPPGAGAFNRFGDFDNGVAQIGDGAFINRPDEGNVATKGQYAYFAWKYQSPTLVNFSPNRMVPSPGMLGSLPTGIRRERPWETLLFRPQEGHPGNETPRDHHLMEYFWMPVVEPYAISVPFATSGKINMNYQMLPFSYIRRATGMHGILKSEEPLAIPNEMSRTYKLWDHETSDHPWLPNQSRGNLDPETRKKWDDAAKGNVVMRKPINPEETLKQFDEKFAASSLFRYPSEICEIHLVRDGETLGQYRNGSFWPRHVVTGDNVKERPYANLYPRLTTRSNTFRVHTRVEVIRKGRGTDPGRFHPDFDMIAGRHRGSTLVERYLNPMEDHPDFADPANAAEDLSDDWQYRLLENRRFSP